MTSQSQIEDEILARRLQSEGNSFDFIGDMFTILTFFLVEFQAASGGNRNNVAPASQVIANSANKVEFLFI